MLVHDFQLMLLPALLRRRFPELRCAYFHQVRLRSHNPHTPCLRVIFRHIASQLTRCCQCFAPNPNAQQCPFPSSEVFRCLPVRKELLQGILGADLLAFVSFNYLRHFHNAGTKLLGLKSSLQWVEYGGRLVSAVVRPLGISTCMPPPPPPPPTCVECNHVWVPFVLCCSNQTRACLPSCRPFAPVWRSCDGGSQVYR